jgi:hypothetical protein
MNFQTLAMVLLAVTLFTSCAAKMSNVTQVGKDTYTLSYNAGMSQATWVEIKAEVLQRANNYCESLGQTMVRPKLNSNHANGLSPKQAQVTFLCQPHPANPPQKK